MKSTLMVILFTVTLSAYGKNTIHQFNQVLLNDVEKEIKKDDENYKQNSRGPASVPVEQNSKIEETHRFDKNVRQIGPNNW